MSSVVYIDIDKIQPNNYNPNVMDEEKFNALVDFCKTNGAEKLDPIWIRRNTVDSFEVIDGEHRWKAAKEVGWKRLRAFVIEITEDDSKAFNVRKNRERGRLDAFKLGRIFHEAQSKNHTHNGIGKQFGISRRSVGEYIEIYKNHKVIREHLQIGDQSPIPYKRAIRLLRELKSQGELPRGRKPSRSFEPTEESQGLEKFLTRYAKALKKTPKPNVATNDVELAIDFFKRILNEKHVTCPICGEEHLQWSCGHEF